MTTTINTMNKTGDAEYVYISSKCTRGDFLLSTTTSAQSLNTPKILV